MVNALKDMKDAVADAVVAELPIVSLSMHTVHDLIEALVQRTKQVTALQERMTAMVESTRARCVRAFHAKFKHPVRHTPAVPADDEVRFRLRLIAEEFLELVDATFDNDGSVSGSSYQAQRDLVRCALRLVIDQFPLSVRLADFVDALEDTSYVIEGTHAVFGVDSAPVAAEVQRANIEKDPNGPDGKPVKPPGWRPPDIEGVLRAQGWQG